MEFEYSKKTKMYQEQLVDFMNKFVYPNESTFRDQLDSQADRWTVPPIMEELKAGIVCSGMNGGSHEATLDMMRMFSEEVMPHFRQDAAIDETASVGR